MLWLAILVSLTPDCPAAWISEVQPTARQALNASQTDQSTIPALVEVLGLAGVVEAELVIINAQDSPTRWGAIQQVVTIGAGQPARILTGGPWPTDIFPFGDPPPGDRVQMIGGGLDLTGSRTLLLFDRVTGLIPLSGKINTPQAQALLAGAQLLDVVTFGPNGSGSARAYQGEAILSLDATKAAARPTLPAGGPGPAFLVGTPDLNGDLLAGSGFFALSPGLTNTVVTAASMPEPTTVAICLAGLLALPAVRHRRICRHN